MALRRKQLQVAHAYEQVSAEIEAQILDGVLQPGEQLPGELELATLFGVNRSTVREGIRRLESEGLVRRSSPRRLVVSLPRAADLATRQTRALRLMEVTFLELWETAMSTEPLAAELAARHADAAALAALRDNQRQLERTAGAGESPVALDTEFHNLVAACSGNRVLQLAREPVGFLLYSGLETLLPHLPQAPERQIEAHRRVIEAIACRDPATARLWMRRHTQDFRRGFELAGLPLDVSIVTLAKRGAAARREPGPLARPLDDNSLE